MQLTKTALTTQFVTPGPLSMDRDLCAYGVDGVFIKVRCILNEENVTIIILQHFPVFKSESIDHTLLCALLCYYAIATSYGVESTLTKRVSTESTNSCMCAFRKILLRHWLTTLQHEEIAISSSRKHISLTANVLKLWSETKYFQIRLHQNMPVLLCQLVTKCIIFFLHQYKTA